MTINLSAPELTELRPRIVVIGVGGAGGNAVNNMIKSGLEGVEFIVANTDAQSLSLSAADRRIQLGSSITQGLGCGARPEVGRAAAEESIDQVLDHMSGTHMAFIAAGMGGGTGTGGAPIIAEALRAQNILTVGVVTRPFQFEGSKRMRIADEGIEELQAFVDTLIIIPNQNLFRVANEKTTFADAFAMADNVLHCGVRGITDLMVMPGLINLDFADVRTVMSEMGKAMMGTGEAGGEKRAVDAAESAISNPLLDEVSMKGARGVLINITGGPDLTLYEVDEAATRIREEVDPDANIIVGSALDQSLEGVMRVSVVATGIDCEEGVGRPPAVRPHLATIAGRALAEPEAAAADAAVEREDAAVPAASPVAQTQQASGASAGVDAPRISEIMSRLSAGRAAVPPAKPITPEPTALKEKADIVGELDDAPFIAPEPNAPEDAELAVEPAPAPEPKPSVIRSAVRGAENAAAEPSAEELAQPAAASQPRKRLSLFARMTGARQRGAATEAASPTKAEPSLQERDEPAEPRLGAGEAMPEQAADSAPAEPMERLTQPGEDEDLLEIPSFLRRRAN